MKKNVLKIMLLALATTVFGGCDSGEKSSIDYLPFKTEKDGMWGMIDKNGKILFKEEFNAEPSICYEGVFSVEENGSVSLYLAKEKPVPIKGCEDLVQAGRMTDGLIPIVRKGERIKFVDKSGKEKFELTPHKSREITKAWSFQDGFAIIENEDNKRGFINTSGKVIIEPIYSNLSYMGEGLFFAEKDSLCMLLDKSGKTVKKLKNETYPISFFVKGKAVFTHKLDEGKETLVLDTKGELIKRYSSNAKDQIIGLFENGYYYSPKDSEDVGVKNFEDEIIIRAKYETIALCGGNFFVQKEENTWALLDEKGDELKEFEDYSYIRVFEDWVIGEIEDNRSIVLDKSGESINKTDYYIGGFLTTRIGVESDYCDIASYATFLTDGLNDKGFGKIALGSSISQFLSNDPAKYAYKSEIVLDSADYSKYGLKFKDDCWLILYSDKYITVSNYDYYAARFVYSFNKAAKVALIGTIAELSKDYHAKSVYEAVLKKLETKGFKSITIPDYNGKHAKYLAKGDIYLLAGCHNDNSVGFFIGKKDVLSEQGAKQLASNIEKSYSEKEAQSSYNDSQDYNDGYNSYYTTETATETPYY